MTAMPLGLGSMAGKSRPETGVQLRNEPSRGSDGQVTAELEASTGNVIAISFYSPWPLVTGAFYDVESRDRSNGEGCYVQVTPLEGSKSLEGLPSSFFTEQILSSKGRFGAYGVPVNVKMVSSRMEGAIRVLEFTFSALSPTYAEVPRHAVVAVTAPEGAKEVVMLVGTASAARWNKGASKLLSEATSSFRATTFKPARAKKAKRNIFAVEEEEEEEQA
uniref:PsbP C-terminal domain-containing protein n=1 Tax=Rhizochromulina marina TaxID=1034831 RepID=A0A7S2SV54_9STRA